MKEFIRAYLYDVFASWDCIVPDLNFVTRSYVICYENATARDVIATPDTQVRQS